MINLNSVTKQFGMKKAVNDVSFEAKKGQIIGFLGPNGAGKTTTMRLILGLLKPSDGKVAVNKFEPVDKRMKVLDSIGYLPENNPLYTTMKVHEYLRFIADVKEVSYNEIEEIAEKVSLDDVIHSKIEQLSRGYRQRVGLAAALLGDPDILILDEPTSGLDPIEQDKIKDLITSLSKQKTVIFSTHILSEVEDVANRLVIINKGEIVYDGDKPKGKGSVETLFKKVIKGEPVKGKKKTATKKKSTSKKKTTKKSKSKSSKKTK